MRAVVQRVSSAWVRVGDARIADITKGYLVYLGIERNDAETDADTLAERIRYLRIFDDAEGKLNRDVKEIGGAVLVVSAFTVCADGRQGRRPSFFPAAPADQALPLYQRFSEALKGLGVDTVQGAFRGAMQVTSDNDGPICVLLDSRKRF